MNAKQAKEILENRFVEVKDEMLYEFLTDKEVFEALLISGISPNSSDNYFKKPILSLAYNKKEYNSFKLLLDYGADPNIEIETEYSSEFKWSLIFSIVHYYPQHKNYFKKIIKHDVNFAALDVNKNNSLLHICVLASSPSAEMAEFLLNKGVDRSLKNNDRYTALDIAQKRYESSSWSTELQEKFAVIMKLLKE
jgi:ankyrin repeat protein